MIKSLRLPRYTCASSPFIHNPAGHVITADLSMIKKHISYTSLRDVFAKGMEK
jgi:hypothetical protein